MKFSICDLLILLLIIGVVLSNYVWLKMDEYPVDGHELLGIIPAAQIYRALKGMAVSYKCYDHILGYYHGCLAYPPLSFLIVALFYFLFGPHGQMVIMVNSLYIAITLICVYLIGKNIFNKPTGLLAAFILSSFPGFIAFSRQYWIEFGLMGYVALDLFLLLKTNFFENRKYSIFLGISLALSFLHKYEFMPFVIGPLLLVIYKSGVLRDILKAKWSKKATNLTLTLTLALALAAFWWARYGKVILERMFTASFSLQPVITERINKVQYLKNIFSFESLIYYLNSISALIRVVFSTLFILSIIYTVKSIALKENKRFYILYLISSFIISYIIFTFAQVKNTTHMLSILPAIAILIGAGLYFIKYRVFKITFAGLIVLYGLYQHLYPFCPFEKLNYIYPVRILNMLHDYSVRIIKCDLPSFFPPRKERIGLR